MYCCVCGSTMVEGKCPNGPHTEVEIMTGEYCPVCGDPWVCEHPTQSSEPSGGSNENNLA